MTDESWLNGLPEEMRAAPQLKKFESIDGLAKSYIEMEAFQGNALRIPGEHASAGDVQEFHEKVMTRVPGLVRKPSLDDEDSVNMFWQSMGRPEKADDYAAIEGIGDAEAAQLREIAMKSNLTNDQYKTVAESLSGLSTQERAVATQQNEEALNALKAKHGEAWDQKVNAINMLKTSLEMDDTLLDLSNPNAKVMELMLKIADKVGTEGGNLQQQIGDNAAGAMTPGEAEIKANEIVAKMMGMQAGPELSYLQSELLKMERYVAAG